MKNDKLYQWCDQIWLHVLYEMCIRDRGSPAYTYAVFLIYFMGMADISVTGKKESG